MMIPIHDLTPLFSQLLKSDLVSPSNGSGEQIAFARDGQGGANSTQRPSNSSVMSTLVRGLVNSDHENAERERRENRRRLKEQQQETSTSREGGNAQPRHHTSAAVSDGQGRGESDRRSYSASGGVRMEERLTESFLTSHTVVTSSSSIDQQHSFRSQSGGGSNRGGVNGGTAALSSGSLRVSRATTPAAGATVGGVGSFRQAATDYR
jgi:hypothetical protein